MTEAEFMAAVRKLATLTGWMTFHDFDSRRNEPGWPDLAMVHPRQARFLVAELKTETGRLTPEQRQWLAALEHAGVETHVWRPADLQRTIPRTLATPQSPKGSAP